MTTSIRHRWILAALLMPMLSACADTPADLAKRVQTTFEAGDMDAATKLAEIDQSPSDLRFFYFDQVNDCGDPKITCKASIGPLDDEFKQRLTEQQAEGLQAVAPPEGLVRIEVHGEGMSGNMSMPYGKVGGAYKLIAFRYSDEAVARQRARDFKSFLDEMLAKGVYDPETRENDMDWQSKAQALPADGGEAGAWFVARSEGLSRAAAANDPDAAASVGDPWAEIIFAAKGFDDKPVPLDYRQRKLRVQSARFIRDVKVHGGYQLGDTAAVAYEAIDSAGWTQRGAALLIRERGQWSIGGTTKVEYPR